MSYLEALLDTVEARDSWVRGHVDAISEEVAEGTLRALTVAARPRATRGDVAKAILDSRVHRVEALGLLHAVHDGDEHARAWSQHRRHAGAGARLPKVGPIRPSHLAARKQARGADSVVWVADGPALRVGGRLPALDRIARMTDAELNLTLRRFGQSIDRTAATARAIERESARLIRTSTPDPALLDRVLDRAEAAVRRELQLSVKEILRDREIEALGHDVEAYTWIVVGDDRMCASCDGRDGSTIAAEDVPDHGPGSHDLLCGGQCRCILEPARQFEPAASVLAMPAPEPEPAEEAA